MNDARTISRPFLLSHFLALPSTQTIQTGFVLPLAFFGFFLLLARHTLRLACRIIPVDTRPSYSWVFL